MSKYLKSELKAFWARQMDMTLTALLQERDMAIITTCRRLFDARYGDGARAILHQMQDLATALTQIVNGDEAQANDCSWRLNLYHDLDRQYDKLQALSQYVPMVASMDDQLVLNLLALRVYGRSKEIWALRDTHDARINETRRAFKQVEQYLSSVPPLKGAAYLMELGYDISAYDREASSAQYPAPIVNVELLRIPREEC